MSRRASWIGGVLLLAIALGLSYVGWQMTRAPGARACGACGRPVHGQSLTVALIGGEHHTLCCPTCALTLGRQTGKEARFQQLTDYQTQQPIRPEGAYIVHESSINLCMRQHALMDQHKEATLVDFDRCAPSLIAFASREDAERFAERNGGSVMSFEDLVKTHESWATP